MTYENKPGSGVMFPNTRKTAENQPDYTGTYYDEIGGKTVERRIAGWRRLNSKGGERINVQVSDKFESKRVGPPVSPREGDFPPTSEDAGFKDEIPF